jgi:hypothetical protein
VGATNVKLAFANWRDLDDRPFRLLTFMALTSLDTDTEERTRRLFYGGRESLALGLGRVVPDEPAPEDITDEALEARRVRNAAFVAVRTAMSQLKARGAVQEIRAAKGGSRAWYRLDLDPQAQGEPAPEAQGEPAPEAQGEPAVRRRVSLHRMSTQEPSQELGPGQLISVGESHQRAGEDGDKPYLDAHRVLELAGPERSEQAMRAARTHHRDATTRQSVIAAAALLETGVAS